MGVFTFLGVSSMDRSWSLDWIKGQESEQELKFRLELVQEIESIEDVEHGLWKVQGGLEYLEVFEYLGVGVGPFTGVGVV